MRPSYRGSAPALAPLVWLALGSCFADPPASSSDTSTGSTTDDASSSAESTGITTELPTSVVSTNDDAIDSSGTATATTDTTAAESGSTGSEPAMCGCPDSSAFCDGFEEWPGPWSLPGGGNGTVMQELLVPRCGDAAARTDVVEGDEYAVLIAEIGATTQEIVSTPYSLRAFVHASPGCDDGDFARILELRLPQQAGGQWYTWLVSIGERQVRLTAGDHVATVTHWYAKSPLPDEWVELRLDFDFGTSPPTAVLEIDGALAIQSDNAPALSASATPEPAAPTIYLGPFLFEAPFSQACTVRYDEVVVVTLETDNPR